MDRLQAASTAAVARKWMRTTAAYASASRPPDWRLQRTGGRQPPQRGHTRRRRQSGGPGGR
eukprot:9239315-Alexandrium_andersonii.AAC.1